MQPDDDDLFGEEYERKRAERAARNPFAGKTPEEIEALAANWEKPRRKSSTPRGKPEKLNQDRIWRHLIDVYGAIPRRINSGNWRTSDGDMIMGAKAGTSDIIAELSIIINETARIGVYFAIETKSMRGTPSVAQEKFIARVKALGGIACVARTPLDVDAEIDRWCAATAAALGVPVRAARMPPKKP